MSYLNTLQSLNKTCIIFSNNEILYTSVKRGVSPLIEYLSSNPKSQTNLILADKIIGKGAVILAQLIGIKEIHTPIISKDALVLANTYKIKCQYSDLVSYIRNRDNTGRCPIESCVLDITDPTIGYKRITDTLQKLQKAT